jgi:hypothetical protein
MKRRTQLALAAALVASGSVTLAHVRLINPSNGAALRWLAPASISIVINATGSADVTDGSHVTALQNALRAWNQAPGSSAKLVENATSAQRARTDWASDDIHLLYFDETGSSGYFPPGSGIVALTPVWFTSGGVITDADILFNGSDYQFTTSKVPARFDVQDVATHELGHLLGLDHSGWAGATMYPYVDPSVILHRSLSLDEVCGMRALYPASTFATIQGNVRRQDSSLVAGAHVVARSSDGRPYAATLSNNSGAFVVRGLVPDTYTLYCSPLDFPVSQFNLGIGNSVSADLQSTVFSPVTVGDGEAVSVGDLVVEPDVLIGLGRNSDDFPVRCCDGQTTSVMLRGSGMIPGSTLTASDPTIIVAPLIWSTTQVSFTVTVPPGTPPGNVDLMAETPAGETSILAAGLEITPRDPIVSSVVPPRGGWNGGTALTVLGSSFHAGASVVIGSRIYADGQPSGCTVVDDSTITLTTLAIPVGTYDVVVIDRSGVEGRAVQAFEAELEPSITSVFPAAGSAAGGTTVVVRGHDFQDGCTITIDGILQTDVTFVDATKLVIATTPGVPGGPYDLEVQNPAGPTATAAFSWSGDPDPAIDAISPAAGKVVGGEVVVITGANFTTACEVRFGADPDTGAGGVRSSSVTLVDAMTLHVVTPASSTGTKCIVVKDEQTNQAAVAPAAYTFEPPASGGGGGGCFGTVSSDPLDGLSSTIAMAAAFALLWWRARSARRAVPAS